MRNERISSYGSVRVTRISYGRNRPTFSIGLVLSRTWSRQTWKRVHNSMDRYINHHSYHSSSHPALTVPDRISSNNSLPLFSTSSLHAFFAAPVNREHTCSSMYDNTLSLKYITLDHRHQRSGHNPLLRCVWHRACTWQSTIRTSTAHSEQEQYSTFTAVHVEWWLFEMILPVRRNDRRSHRDDHRLWTAPVQVEERMKDRHCQQGWCLPHCWQRVHRYRDHDAGPDLRTRDRRWSWASVGWVGEWLTLWMSSCVDKCWQSSLRKVCISFRDLCWLTWRSWVARTMTLQSIFDSSSMGKRSGLPCSVITVSFFSSIFTRGTMVASLHICANWQMTPES